MAIIKADNTNKSGKTPAPGADPNISAADPVTDDLTFDETDNIDNTDIVSDEDPSDSSDVIEPAVAVGNTDPVDSSDPAQSNSNTGNIGSVKKSSPVRKSSPAGKSSAVGKGRAVKKGGTGKKSTAASKSRGTGKRTITEGTKRPSSNKISAAARFTGSGIETYFEGVFTSLKTSAKWILFGILCGAIVGTIASIFAIAIRTGTQFRAAHPFILAGLPIAGLVIVFAYHKLGFADDGGTNTVLEAIREGEHVPIQMAPLIFIGTVLTHMFGGSAGREGAALQIGGSIGNGIGRFLRFQKSDNKRTIMCGMSAAFSALFGTPLAAAILPIEISTVGIMYYSSLLPCVLSSLVAFYIAQAFGLSGEAYKIGAVNPISLPTALLTVLLSLACALAAILFCATMDKVSKLLRKYFPNDFVRVVVGGVIVIILTIIVGSQTYNGAGANIIELCFEGDPSKVFILAFLLKIIFTAFTLSSGYKGGEIVPALFIGATLGVHFGNLVGISPSLFAALGMGALFCGVTNCPIASLLICFEMFGFETMPYFLLVISFTYLFSGNFGLYHGQVIRYSKYEPGKINEHAHH